MASIVLKFQKCGKENCGCHREGRLHGPYFWLVTYQKDVHVSSSTNKKYRGRRGKYVWKYLGKQVDRVVRVLVESSVAVGSLGKKSQRLLEREIEDRICQVLGDDAQAAPEKMPKTRTYPLIENVEEWIEAKLDHHFPAHLT